MASETGSPKENKRGVLVVWRDTQKIGALIPTASNTTTNIDVTAQ